jgi:hypothetical protein
VCRLNHYKCIPVITIEVANGDFIYMLRLLCSCSVSWTYVSVVYCSLKRGYHFYAPISKDRGHIVLGLHVHLSVCKKFNFGHMLWLINDRAFIFHMCVPCDKDLSIGTLIFYFMTSTLKFNLLFKNLNIDHILWMVSDRAFIIYTCVPCDKTFPLGLFHPVTLTLKFDGDCHLWSLPHTVVFVFYKCILPFLILYYIG